MKSMEMFWALCFIKEGKYSSTFFSLERRTDCESGNDVASWEIWNENATGAVGGTGNEIANDGEIWIETLT